MLTLNKLTAREEGKITMTLKPVEGKITLNVERPTASKVSLSEIAIRLHPTDKVAIAKKTLLPGLQIETGSEEGLIPVRQLVQPGHKVALRAVEEVQPVRRYGQIIG